MLRILYSVAVLLGCALLAVADEARPPCSLTVTVRLDPLSTPATNDMRQFYADTNILVEIETVRAVWPKDYAPKVIVQQIGDKTFMAPQLVLGPVEGFFDLQNTSPSPQLITGGNAGMGFHAYLLPGITERRTVMHKGMLELTSVTAVESHAIIYTTPSLHRLVPSGQSWTIDTLSPGMHRVRIWHPAYGEVRKAVPVREGKSASLDLLLSKPRPYNVIAPLSPALRKNP